MNRSARNVAMTVAIAATLLAAKPAFSSNYFANAQKAKDRQEIVFARGERQETVFVGNQKSHIEQKTISCDAPKTEIRAIRAVKTDMKPQPPKEKVVKALFFVDGKPEFLEVVIGALLANFILQGFLYSYKKSRGCGDAEYFITHCSGDSWRKTLRNRACSMFYGKAMTAFRIAEKVYSDSRTGKLRYWESLCDFYRRVAYNARNSRVSEAAFNGLTALFERNPGGLHGPGYLTSITYIASNTVNKNLALRILGILEKEKIGESLWEILCFSQYPEISSKAFKKFENNKRTLSSIHTSAERVHDHILLEYFSYYDPDSMASIDASGAPVNPLPRGAKHAKEKANTLLREKFGIIYGKQSVAGSLQSSLGGPMPMTGGQQDQVYTRRYEQSYNQPQQR